MQTNRLTVVILFSCISAIVSAQNSKVLELKPENWTAFNRDVTYGNGEVYLNAQENDGVLWLNNSNFKNNTIELDIKGKDVQGRSFVGVAFYGQDNNTFDGIYFRPFNFKSPERKTHSVQYISMPDNDWSVLRNAFPGKYENTVDPVPDPNDWFHAKIVVESSRVKVYVNGSTTPSLEVEQISDRAQGMFGLWVGNGSDGYFKNVSVSPK